MTFGARLKGCRESKGLSQQQLGKGLGTNGKNATKAVVSGWENGKHFPKVDQLLLMCERLGASADYLVLGNDGRRVYTPQVSKLAADLDDLDPDYRDEVISLCRQVIALRPDAGKRQAGSSN